MNPNSGQAVNPPAATTQTPVTAAQAVPGVSQAGLSQVLPFPPFVTLLALIALALVLAALAQWLWNLPHLMAHNPWVDRLGGPSETQHKVLRFLAFLSIASGLLFGQFGSAVLVACGLMVVAYLRERRA